MCDLMVPFPHVSDAPQCRFPLHAWQSSDLCMDADQAVDSAKVTYAESGSLWPIYTMFVKDDAGSGVPCCLRVLFYFCALRPRVVNTSYHSNNRKGKLF